MACGNDTLTPRSGRTALAAYDAGEGLRYAEILRAKATDGEVRWRVVELSGEGPWRAELTWTAGEEGGLSAEVDVARATRVCVAASDVMIRGASWLGASQKVVATVVDGQQETRNALESQGTLPAEGGQALIAVPPYAVRVRLDAYAAGALPSTRLQLVDAGGNLVGEVSHGSQPGGGLPVGRLRQVRVLSEGAIVYRLTFTLAL